MVVQRFRTIEEMNAAPVRRGSPEGFERFIRHCARFRRAASRPRPRGVFKFRSLEEAQRARLSGHSAPAPASRGVEATDPSEDPNDEASFSCAITSLLSGTEFRDVRCEARGTIGRANQANGRVGGDVAGTGQERGAGDYRR